jgi:branched-chain amino acid transport system permease protein
LNAQIALFLLQDGATNGAVYALLALAILLVFSVTRVLFIPQGEFVSYAALSMAALQAGKPAALVWLTAAMAVAVALADAWDWKRHQRRAGWPPRIVPTLAWPFLLAALLYALPVAALPMWLQALLTIGVVVPMGPQLYRLFYQPIAGASVLVLLIVSIAVHLALVGLGLLIFGPEGSRTAAFSDARFMVGPASIASQTIWVVVASAVLMATLYRFSGASLYGKALRAAAANRLGASLVGISPVLAGKLAFLLAALVGAVSGILIAPVTTLYFDSGFLISLKGFVGAIIGGLASYPGAVAGAVLVGLIEAYASFWASAYKEIIVFTLIIPVLLWRSLQDAGITDDEEELE